MKVLSSKKHFFMTAHAYHWVIVVCIIVMILTLGIFSINYILTLNDSLAMSQQETVAVSDKSAKTTKQLASIKKELDDLKNQDQVTINKKNQDTIAHIEDTYTTAVALYEKLLDLKTVSKNTSNMDTLFAASLSLLADKNYASASADLTTLSQAIQQEQAKIAAANVPAVNAPIAQNVPVNNTPPGNGFGRQSVTSDAGTFLVDIVAADLSSTRVIVDTASDSDCRDNCPTLSLGDYVARSGAYAGINGTYFCPSTYPSCAGKTNSFDLLVMNKNKHYVNSDNNVYSTNPAVIFSNGSIRFVGRALEWGRDTGVDGVLSNYPLLVSGGNVSYSDNPDPKFTSKGPRGFVANKGNTVYIGFIYNATMGEASHVLKTLSMDNAMNLDEGGSTALWDGGYKAGPGRNIPNAILFVRK